MRSSIQHRQDESGFTLVELLVVILIIGILAAIAIPAFMNQRKSANDAALKSDVHNMALAVETFLSSPANTRDAYNNQGIVPEQSGWYVIGLGENGIFGGARNVGEYYPADFPEVTLSEGSGIGVITSGASRRPAGSFCVAGNMNNSSYQLKDPLTENIWRNMLYYDSRLGGIYEANELPANGACFSYYTRIHS